MKTPTFKEQYDKIVNAYMKNELQPLLCKYCFVGNLLNNSSAWAFVKGLRWGELDHIYSPSFLIGVERIDIESNGLYTPQEIVTLEKIFMVDDKGCHFENDEDQFFCAMERTLLYLRKIHESKGEVIEDYNFNKRELCTV